MLCLTHRIPDTLESPVFFCVFLWPLFGVVLCFSVAIFSYGRFSVALLLWRFPVALLDRHRLDCRNTRRLVTRPPRGKGSNGGQHRSDPDDDQAAGLMNAKR